VSAFDLALAAFGGFFLGGMIAQSGTSRAVARVSVGVGIFYLIDLGKD